MAAWFASQVGKDLPKQFPEPFSVGKQNVGIFTCIYYKDMRSQKLLRQIQGGSINQVIHYLNNC